MSAHLLDTHVLLWWVDGPGRLSRAQQRFLEKPRTEPLLVSDVSLQEIAGLVSVGRLRVRSPLRDWLEKLVAMPRVRLLPISPAIAAEVATLPPTLHRDPADRALIATARVLDATLVTCDQRIIDASLCRVLG